MKRRKITNEANKERLTPEMNEIKSLLQQDIPIEQVIYINENEHKSGTNRYTINYPEIWRTIPNQQLILSVRSICLRNYPRDIGISFTFDVYKEAADPRQEWDILPLDDFKYSGVYNPGIFTLDRLCESMNRQFNVYRNAMKEKFGVDYLVDFDRWDIRYVDSFSLYWKESFTQKWAVKCNIKHFSETKDIRNIIFDRNNSEDFNPLFPDIAYRRPVIKFKDQHYADTDYLLAASFVNQTDHYYLGFVNSTFNPPKMYVIPRGDTNFWVDIFTPDAQEQRELPDDGKAFITIECQLLTKPMSKYI